MRLQFFFKYFLKLKISNLFYHHKFNDVKIKIQIY